MSVRVCASVRVCFGGVRVEHNYASEGCECARAQGACARVRKVPVRVCASVRMCFGRGEGGREGCECARAQGEGNRQKRDERERRGRITAARSLWGYSIGKKVTETTTTGHTQIHTVCPHTGAHTYTHTHTHTHARNILAGVLLLELGSPLLREHHERVHGPLDRRKVDTPTPTVSHIHAHAHIRHTEGERDHTHTCWGTAS